jgi:hypothetical protein
MKIKNYKNRKTDKVLVEFDEFYTHSFSVSSEDIDKTANEFAGRRMAYNMWEFENTAKAEEFMFVFNLKHANNS